jgi:siroheme synthase-like protein
VTVSTQTYDSYGTVPGTGSGREAGGAPAAAEKRYYMACIDLVGRRCLVVGGGAVACEKALGLLDCGARVTVVAPDVSPAVRALPVEIVEREYRAADVDGRILVVAATDDTDVNRRVFADAEARGLLCNVADVPELCSFILPAVHREGPIAIAVSTGGASPALAQRIRAELASRYGAEHAELARLLRALRPWAKARFPTYEERRDFFQRVVDEALA